MLAAGSTGDAQPRDPGYSSQKCNRQYLIVAGTAGHVYELRSERLEDDLHTVLQFSCTLGTNRKPGIRVIGLSGNDVVSYAAGLIQARCVRGSAIYVCEGCATIHAVDLIAAEVGMVEQVEEVHAELDADSLAPYTPVLIDREVRIDGTGPVA